MKSIFAIASSASLSPLRDTRFFSSKESARAVLKDMRNDRRHKMGVNVIEDTDDKFSYLFGWEEHQVTFTIVEISLE
jgi:hypothetical protein